MSRPPAGRGPGGAGERTLAGIAGSLAVRRFVYQAATLLLVGLGLYYLVSNTAANLVRQGIAYGFDFLVQEAGYDIAEAWIPYSPRSTYGRGLVVGFLNTLYVSAVGIMLTTVVGTLLGVARVSSNWLLAKASAVYVEIFRNTPLLLQIIFWMTVMRQLPVPRQALNPAEGVFLTNRGIMHPLPVADPVHGWMLWAFIAGVVLAIALHRWSRRRAERTGRAPPVLWFSAGSVVGLPLLAWLAGGAPTALQVPVLQGFNFAGGASHSPEFVALVLGLVAYTSAFVAEIVRAGIESVGAGQWEAARSLGIDEGHILTRIILPQALRVIIPPLTNQYLNLIKDSSLAVAIGYPELVNVANTAINQTGQAVEMIFIMMAVYLTLSLVISAGMNLYNRLVALEGSR
jgi:general L-amino acid transport system permease protein